MYEKPSIKRKDERYMKIATEIFEKATIRGLADYLLFGLPPNPDDRDYKKRLDDTYEEFEKIALGYDPNGASELLSSANDIACENACVYLEIGIQVGILLLADMFQNIQGERKNSGIDYGVISKTMSEDIKKALDMISGEAEENEKIKKACDMLKRWENLKTKQQK